MKSKVSIASFLGISCINVNSSGENEVSCAFLRDTLEMYQSPPFISNFKKVSDEVSVASIFWDTVCLVLYISEPSIVKKFCS